MVWAHTSDGGGRGGREDVAGTPLRAAVTVVVDAVSEDICDGGGLHIVVRHVCSRYGYCGGRDFDLRMTVRVIVRMNKWTRGGQSGKKKRKTMLSMVMMECYGGVDNGSGDAHFYDKGEGGKTGRGAAVKIEFGQIQQLIDFMRCS